VILWGGVGSVSEIVFFVANTRIFATNLIGDGYTRSNIAGNVRNRRGYANGESAKTAEFAPSEEIPTPVWPKIYVAVGRCRACTGANSRNGRRRNRPDRYRRLDVTVARPLGRAVYYATELFARRLRPKVRRRRIRSIKRTKSRRLFSPIRGWPSST